MLNQTLGHENYRNEPVPKKTLYQRRKIYKTDDLQPRTGFFDHKPASAKLLAESNQSSGTYTRKRGKTADWINVRANIDFRTEIVSERETLQFELRFKLIGKLCLSLGHFYVIRWQLFKFDRKFDLSEIRNFGQRFSETYAKFSVTSSYHNRSDWSRQH